MSALSRLSMWTRIALCDSVAPSIWHTLFRELSVADMELDYFLALSRLERQRAWQTSDSFERALLNHPEDSARMDKLLRELEERNIRTISVFDRQYPPAIKQHLQLNAPPVLFAWGDLRSCAKVSLAMVGRQAPSARGAASARAYARALSEQGVVIVSGGARGIDSLAHLGALEGKATTIFVLPLGVLAWRAPTELRQLMTEENALALSAWPPDKTWSTRYALARNKLIAALGDGLFAVETGLKGGTAYSVREATRTRKPLWTLIYAPEDTPEAAKGNHSLLGSHAHRLRPVDEDDQPEVETVVAQLREEHRLRPRDVAWPPSENPEQGELFA